MCYNEFTCIDGKLCRVIIRSCGEGWNSDVTCNGKLYLSEKDFCINYQIDGDDCTLNYSDGILTQQRKGMQNLYLSFSEGKETSCIIGEGELSGSFVIKTRKLQILQGKGGIRISLEYNSGSDKELISLSMTVIKI